MDFSAWNWATSFRVHEAACLIAGVMPISKRYPTSEELPPQARPILVKLLSAYVEWILQTTNPSRPKSTVLEGYLNDDGTVPEISSLAELPGALVSRKAINRFLSEMAQEHGYKSAYDFDPIGKTGAQQIEPTPVELPLNEAPTPDEPAPAQPEKETPAERRARWLSMFEEEAQRASRGALQRLANREGVDRANMSKYLDKARKERDTQRRTGFYSQLVQDGKRTT